MTREFSAWAMLVATVLAACAGPAHQTGLRQAERLARRHVSDVVGAVALERSRVEVRPSACGWMVVFRGADARCGEAPCGTATIAPEPTSVSGAKAGDDNGR